MKNKLLNILLFFSIFSIYSQEQELSVEKNLNTKQNNVLEYNTSKKEQQKLNIQSFKNDFDIKMKLALEFIDSNKTDVAIQRFLEIIYLYPQFISEKKNQEFILNKLYELYLQHSDMNNFFNFIENLKEMNILDPEIVSSIKEKYNNY